MKFCNFLLRVDGIREASIDDFKSVIEKGLRTYRPEHQKYLYSILKKKIQVTRYLPKLRLIHPIIHLALTKLVLIGIQKRLILQWIGRSCINDLNLQGRKVMKCLIT